MNRIILALYLALSSIAANAGTGSGLVKIQFVGKFGGHDIVFFFTDSHESAPSCNDYKSRWALDISTDLGRAQYSLLLSAQAQSKPVVINGSAICNLYANSETVAHVGFK